MTSRPTHVPSDASQQAADTPSVGRRSLLLVGGGALATAAASAASVFSGPAASAAGASGGSAKSAAVDGSTPPAPAGVDTDDTGAATLEAAVAATATGGRLTVTRAWTRATSLVLDRPMTVVFADAPRSP